MLYTTAARSLLCCAGEISGFKVFTS